MPKRSSADPDPNATEPIALPVGGPVGTATKRAARGRPSGRGADAAGASRRDDHAARRELAAAERARRRYERQEVRRFTRRSRLRRATWITVVSAVVAIGIAAVAVAYSPLMALREVRVEGTSRIAAAEVRAAFDDRVGTPLPLIAPDEVQRALSEFPLIETYTTETVPPGTLVVRIVERTPVGVLDTSSGLMAVDAAGVVVERVDEVPEALPLIEVEGGIDDAAFRAAGRVLRSLPAELRAEVASVTAESADDVRFVLDAGSSVVWGSAEDAALKTTVLRDLMAAVPPDQVSRYDVSAPLSPVTG
ncbi:FtsQ-type POTRA domain-containing protein [Agromyces bracchium]|uniref:FtsQ-type POTRA domain-containing protein n=1 Tax=Agromyces bracchium TaxID=88376 RepID=A0A6I3MAD1_9MICO|nr:FtsQ-type POTRA domain-containing protein [Agromyces bracchium]MTH68306.1 FtsQ-type POTRA domain-containing protein [Agromyces bracchium]